VTIELDVEVLRLLYEQVTSYEQLEALLLLHAAPGRDWTVTEVAAALHIDTANAAAALTALGAQRLLSVKSSGAEQDYRYAPADGAMAAGVDKLAQSYAERRLEVVKQMSANAIERVRSSAARTFADAFLLGDRKKRDRDDR
jgi:DNA-directed RNA polymerase specialized sigma subunit